MRLKIEGVKMTGAAIKAKSVGAIRGTRRGVRMAIEEPASESQREVPRITGGLADSMRVAVTGLGDLAVRGTVTYTAKYAAVVHEVPRPASSNGKWKYLEDPWKRAEPGFARVIADEIERAMKEAA